MIVERNKYFASIKGVRLRLDDQDLLKNIGNEYSVVKATRIMNRNKEKTHTVKIELADESALEYVVKNGIYNENYHYRVEHWVKSVFICYKCNKFDHKAEDCKEKDDKCAKCSSNHRTKDCTVRQPNYVCPNCGGNHPVWSRDCKHYVEKQISINNQHNQWASIVKNNCEKKQMRISTSLTNNKKHEIRSQISRNTNDQEHVNRISEDQVTNRSILDALNKLNTRMDAFERRIENSSEPGRIDSGENQQVGKEQRLLIIIEKQSKQIEELLAEINSLKISQQKLQSPSQHQIMQQQNLLHQQQHHVQQQHVAQQQHITQQQHIAQQQTQHQQMRNVMQAQATQQTQQTLQQQQPKQVVQQQQAMESHPTGQFSDRNSQTMQYTQLTNVIHFDSNSPARN